MKRIVWLLLALVGLVVPVEAFGQGLIIDHTRIIRPIPPRPPTPRPVPSFADYHVRNVDVQAAVKDQVAKVQVSQVFQNTGGVVLEAQFFFPLPDDAAISGLTLLVDGTELAGKLLKKEDARRIYEDIVRRRQDPALLEYMGQGLFQTSVFPIPPNAHRTVEIRYTQLLKKTGGLVDLLLPLGTNKHSTKPIDNLNVTVRVEANEAIKTIYSPTHQLDIHRPDNTHATCKLTLSGVHRPDDFRLFYGTAGGIVGTSVLTYKPSDSEDGYFLLLASPEVKPPANAGSIDRTLLFVFDKSGSMSGKKIEQAKEALKFLINQLKPSDTFNIIAYDSVVETFRPELQRADEPTVKAALAFADGLYAGGSTHIDGALQTGLRMLTDPKRPTYVLFMTDGLPTVGEVRELPISENAKKANTVGARLFAFGVGYDVNSRLLDRISRDGRGQSVYVRPNENIEAHVSSLYAKIGSPLMTDLAVSIDFDRATPPGSAGPINRMYPKQLTDLFHGEQLVLAGRYKAGGAAKVTLNGKVMGETRTITFPANFVEKSNDESFGFVEKLWATRRIGEIIDELDLKGHNQELVDELVQLSIKHGILTPYTSFLADENVRLADSTVNSRRAGGIALRELERADGFGAVEQRALKGRLQTETAPAAGGGAGLGGPGLSKSLAAPAATAAAKRGSALAIDAEGKARYVDSVRNIGQKTFFFKNKQWQDSVVNDEQVKNARRVKQFSTEYFDLAASHGGTLAKYLAFEEPVLVNLANEVYLIEPADPGATP